ncbi:MAG: condensation domain-containing protein, partial [Bacteroidota bacterium]
MIALLNKINEHGILLELEEGKLELYTENTQVDPNLLQEIKDNKQALIDYLSRSAQADVAQEQEYEIPVAPPQDNYPLSSAQRQLWLISQFELANVAYNSLGAYQLMGALNKESLTKAFSSLVERHEILRTYFRQNEEGDPRQFIVPIEESELSVIDHDLRGAEDQDKAIRKILQQQAGTPFNLSEAPLLRIVLIQTADEEFLLLHVMHHIISDAWSMEVLSRELFVLYNGICHSTTPHLPPLRVQYKDYAQWQQEQLATEEMKRHQGYWLEQFQGELPVLDRLGDKNRPAFKTYNGKVLERTLDRNIFVQLQQIAKEEGATLFMTLLAAVKALLFRYTGQQDIILGSATAGRDHLDLENQIGYYINPLALRTRFEAVDGFRELLKRVKDTTLGAYEHQLYPFDQLIEDLQLSQNLSRSPLFDVSVLLQNTNTINYDKGEQAAVMQGIQIQDYKLDVLSSSKFDISIGFMASGEDLFFSMDYNTDVFSDEWIQTFANHFEQLVASIIQQPSLSIAQLPYLTAEEKHSLCHTFNDTQKDFAKDISFLDLFQQQLAAHPDHPAVSFHG